MLILKSMIFILQNVKTYKGIKVPDPSIIIYFHFA